MLPQFLINRRFLEESAQLPYSMTCALDHSGRFKIRELREVDSVSLRFFLATSYRPLRLWCVRCVRVCIGVPAQVIGDLKS